MAPAAAAGEAATGARFCHCDQPTEAEVACLALSPGFQGSPRHGQSRTCCPGRYRSCGGEEEEGEEKHNVAAAEPWAAAAWEPWQSSAWKGRLRRSLQPGVKKV